MFSDALEGEDIPNVKMWLHVLVVQSLSFLCCVAAVWLSVTVCSACDRTLMFMNEM